MAISTPTNPISSPENASGQGYGFAFIAMTSLFFFWGFITVLNDILIPHLKAAFDLNYTQAMLVQFCFFGAYFIISPFASRLIDRVGYQTGIVVGLCTTAVGALLFYPSAEIEIYSLFLFAFFVLASGITILQVSANPYVAALGSPETAASRLNLAQALNSLGTTVGPIVGALLILDVATSDAEAVQMPYLMISALLLTAAFVFSKIKLPVLAHMEVKNRDEDGSVWQHKSLILGALAIFLYVGGEVAIGSFLVNYFAAPEIAGMSETTAGEMVAYYWGAAMVGRFIGAAAMKYIKPSLYLAVNAVLAISLIVVSMNSSGNVAVWSILAVGFFNSIMFPTIFTLAIEGLGPMTSKGSGFVCQAIVGGALIPLIQGVVADSTNVQMSFIVPAICYLYVTWFAMRAWRVAPD